MVTSASPAATVALILVRATVFVVTISARQPMVMHKHASAVRCKAPVLAPATAAVALPCSEAYQHDWPSANRATELQLNSVIGADPAFH